MITDAQLITLLPPFLCSHTLIHYESMLCWYTGEPRWTPWVTLPLGQGQQGARNAGAPKCVCPYLSLCAWIGKLAEITKDEAAVAAEDEGWRVRDGAGAGAGACAGGAAAAAAVTGGAWRWRTVADDMMTVKTMMRHDGRDQHDQWSDVNRHTRWRQEHGWTHFKPLQLGLELRPSSVCSTRLCTPSTSSAATRREISLLRCRHIGVQVGIRPPRPPTCSWIEMLREGYVYFFFAAGFGFFLGGSWFYAFLLLCFSVFLLFCFSYFSACLLLCFSASLLFFFSAFVLLCLSTSTILLFLFFSHVFCCSTSCSSASLLPVFTASLFFFFSFALLSPVCILNETLKTLGETQRNPKEILIRTDKKLLYTWNPKWHLKKP